MGVGFLWVGKSQPTPVSLATCIGPCDFLYIELLFHPPKAPAWATGSGFYFSWAGPKPLVSHLLRKGPRTFIIFPGIAWASASLFKTLKHWDSFFTHCSWTHCQRECAKAGLLYCQWSEGNSSGQKTITWPQHCYIGGVQITQQLLEV